MKDQAFTCIDYVVTHIEEPSRNDIEKIMQIRWKIAVYYFMLGYTNLSEGGEIKYLFINKIEK